MPKVIVVASKIRSKSDFQEWGCSFCSEKAIFEAAIGNAAVRCCQKATCKSKAKKRAEVMYLEYIYSLVRRNTHA